MPVSSQTAVPLYESFDEYDRFVNWDRRLAYELPFVERQLQSLAAQMQPVQAPSDLRVLDVACGTGRHAIALAQRGYSVTGVDLSPAMIERARANAAAAGVDGVSFAVAGFGLLSEHLPDAVHPPDGFNAVLCLGNSLPHVLTEEALCIALEDMAAVLRPGGLLLVQTRNMDAVMDQRSRWMPLQARREEALVPQTGREWLFVRFYDFNEDGTITFNVVTLERGRPDRAWKQKVDATRLYPWRYRQLVEAVGAAGFVDLVCYGDMAGARYDRESSGNLVLVARRKRG
jgi:SAM-dependent methyltransferase